jgi:hypothetical protein
VHLSASWLRILGLGALIVKTATCCFSTRFLHGLPDLIRRRLDFAFRLFLEANNPIARRLSCADQLVNLYGQSFAFPVLSVLQKEHHQERHYRRRRVYDDLPRIGKPESWAGDSPYDYNSERNPESIPRASKLSRSFRKAFEP